jgi:CubicO group peptidase (beta-lactamase class C family)
MKKLLLLITLCCGQAAIARNEATSFHRYADSIRKKYHIPELAYAVVSSNKVYEMQVIGIKKAGTQLKASTTDRFRIGSNTKAITGLVAAQLVKQGKLSWNTKFFDLFPEMKAASNTTYHKLTLIDLLSFRTLLFPYTYTYAEPKQDQFKGNEEQQRYQFTTWFMKHDPVVDHDQMHFSNLGYVAAGLMMEKASGKTYKQLVTDLGKELGIDFGFGPPNATDPTQPWGHDAQLKPEPPANNYKLNWLLAAGNINVSLPDYIKFIQLQLQGLAGRSTLLTANEFSFLHYGRSRFAVGWFWEKDDKGQRYSYNIGNPGTFLSKVYVYHDKDRAYILIANAQTDDVNAGLDVLYGEMKRVYGK